MKLLPVSRCHIYSFSSGVHVRLPASLDASESRGESAESQRGGRTGPNGKVEREFERVIRRCLLNITPLNGQASSAFELTGMLTASPPPQAPSSFVLQENKSQSVGQSPFLPQTHEARTFYKESHRKLPCTAAAAAIHVNIMTARHPDVLTSPDKVSNFFSAVLEGDSDKLK